MDFTNSQEIHDYSNNMVHRLKDNNTNWTTGYNTNLYHHVKESYKDLFTLSSTNRCFLKDLMKFALYGIHNF